MLRASFNTPVDQHDRRAGTLQAHMPKALIGVLGVLVLHAPAFARFPRHARPDPQIQVVLSDAVKPFPSGPATPPSIRPTITADDVLAIEGLATGPVRTDQEQLIAADRGHAG
jgi:hypothetical protein